MTDDTTQWQGGPPWLFYLGFLLFLGSAALFIADLVRGVDVLRSVAANGVAVALLIVWAGLDTLHDPDSAVASAGGAAGTALLLYGLYLFAAGAIIVLTGLFHAHLRLGFYYVGLAVAAVLVGALIFPTDSFGEAAKSREGTTETDDTAEGMTEVADSTDEKRASVDSVDGMTESADSVDGMTESTDED